MYRITDTFLLMRQQLLIKQTGAKGKVVVGGSSSVSPVMEKLVEAYSKANTNIQVDVQTTDSTTGVSSAVEGSYDIGMASRDLKDDETAQGVEGTDYRKRWYCSCRKQ